MFSGYLDKAFKDSNLSKLDIEVYWRLRTCTTGHAKNQKVLCDWTGRDRGTISKSIKRLKEHNYVAIEDSKIVPISHDENVSSRNQNVSSRNQNVSSRQHDTIYIKHKENINKYYEQNNDGVTSDKQRIKEDEFTNKYFLPLDSNIQSDNRYINLSRRPLKKYTDIWISPIEFKNHINECKSNDILVKDTLKRVDDWIKEKKVDGVNISRLHIVSALNSWAITNEIQASKIKKQAELTNQRFNKIGE